jgi:uncharacterized protein YkwD
MVKVKQLPAQKKRQDVYQGESEDINIKMKYLFIIVCFFSYSKASSQKLDLLKFRLDARYEINQNYSLKLAQKKISSGSQNPHAYFIAIKLNMMNASSDLNTTKSYLLMSTAISQARRYKKIKIIDSSLINQRSDLLVKLAQKSHLLQVRLDDLGKFAKSSRLKSKLERLNSTPKTKKHSITAKSVDSLVTVPKFFEGKYFGLPIGNELVPSNGLSQEKEIVRLLNIARNARGQTELIWEEGLAKAARYHAYDMATQKYFNHDSYDRINGDLVKVGGTFERIKMFYSSSFVNSENIAAGGATGAATYKQWYNSKGHYHNMFNPSAKRVGY